MKFCKKTVILEKNNFVILKLKMDQLELLIMKKKKNPKKTAPFDLRTKTNLYITFYVKMIKQKVCISILDFLCIYEGLNVKKMKE